MILGGTFDKIPQVQESAAGLLVQLGEHSAFAATDAAPYSKNRASAQAAHEAFERAFLRGTQLQGGSRRHRPGFDRSHSTSRNRIRKNGGGWRRAHLDTTTT